LVLDPSTRQRMRFNGRGLRSADAIFLKIEQAYGNCPKYIQLRRPQPDSDARPGRVRARPGLDTSARAAIEAADAFFIASFRPDGGADASHRGGCPGFVRVLDDRRLAFADYPGNNMFNTLGNLDTYSKLGLLFVDFTRGDVL